MRANKRWLTAIPLAAVAMFALPGVAMADSLDAANNGTLADSVAINSMWVIVAGVLVMFMQAGFAFLEIGFSRSKNAGLGIAKILTNYSIASLAYWAVGFALAFGGTGAIAGTEGWFLDVGSTPAGGGQWRPP